MKQSPHNMYPKQQGDLFSLNEINDHSNVSTPYAAQTLEPKLKHISILNNPPVHLVSSCLLDPFHP